MLGLGLGLNQRSGGAGAFSPASLFANGEDGVWFEPAIGALQTSSGVIDESGTADPVGFQLSRANGAGFSGGAFTGLGSERANGSWTQQIGSGTIAGSGTSVVATATSDNDRAEIPLSTAGVFCLVEGTVNTLGGSYPSIICKKEISIRNV